MAADTDKKDRNKSGLLPELQKKYDAILFEFGMKMASGRKRYKLTQEDLAEALGLAPKGGKNRMSEIERGEVPVKFPFMMRIADLFEMELEIRWIQKKSSEPRKQAKGKDDNNEDFPIQKTTGITE